MRAAANFLNAILQGRTLGEMRGVVGAEIARRRGRARRAVARPDRGRHRALGRGRRRRPRPADRARPRATCSTAPSDAAQLERIRELFDDLERKRDLAQLLELTEGGDGVRVFIGSENKLFSLSGSSLVVSPYMNADRKIIGAVGVIGPTRLNYGRIVPIVDYTAQLVGRLVSSRGQG